MTTETAPTKPQRVCFQLQVKPDRIEAYREAHAAVWPDMLEALDATGWRNYSIFLRPDGLVIGYFEADDLQRCLDGMAKTEVNARWQAAMADNVVAVTDSSGRQLPADQAFDYIPEVFNLAEQLSASQRL